MNKIDESIQNLKTALNNDELIKQYLALKEAIENSNELKELKDNILSLNKANKINEMKVMKEVYDSHPLIVNFNALKEDVMELLNEIKDELESI